MRYEGKVSENTHGEDTHVFEYYFPRPNAEMLERAGGETEGG